MIRIAILLICLWFFVLVCLMLLSFFGTEVGGFIDGRRFADFDRQCLSAKERIYKKINANSLDIESYVEDAVSQGIVNETYASQFIVWKLMQVPQVVRVINVRYKDASSVFPECRLPHVKVVSSLESMSDYVRCMDMPKSDDVPDADVIIRFKYGQVRDYIRPFKMLLIDSKRNEVIAEQSSYEILLGDMYLKKNRAWYGMGSAQVSRACKLTPPREFIAKVIKHA